LLNRKDIDAVIIATSDHWHDHIAIEAMKKGKAVYCEKPMVQHINEGHNVIQAQKANKSVFQVGSQRVSSVMFAEAKRMLQAGAIGDINLVEGMIDRLDALGAWQYSIPPDATPQRIDWDRFLGDAPKRPFDPVRFFRWRNYKDYGTGVPGDLFVHLISGLHFMTDSYGPDNVFASGALSMWKDGRDVPDVMTSVMHYPSKAKLPEFQVQLRVNLADGSGGCERTRIVGTEGVIDIGWNDFVLKKHKLPKAPGYGGWDSFNTFPKAIQEAFVKEYEKKYPPETRTAPQEKDIRFTAPDNYDDRLDHFRNFFEAMRNGKTIVEDATFGLRAAGPALLCNESYAAKKNIRWDGEKMQIIDMQQGVKKA
jgi:predicted dehydrogenase